MSVVRELHNLELLFYGHLQKIYKALAMVETSLKNGELTRSGLVTPEHLRDAEAVPALNKRKPKKASKGDKPDTKRVTLEMYQVGKSIKTIVADRALARTTIEGHLAHWVEQGMIAIGDLVSDVAVEKISAAFAGRDTLYLSPVKVLLENRYDYAALRLVAAHVRRQRTQAGAGTAVQRLTPVCLIAYCFRAQA